MGAPAAAVESPARQEAAESVLPFCEADGDDDADELCVNQRSLRTRGQGESTIGLGHLAWRVEDQRASRGENEVRVREYRAGIYVTMKSERETTINTYNKQE